MTTKTRNPPRTCDVCGDTIPTYPGVGRPRKRCGKETCTLAYMRDYMRNRRPAPNTPTNGWKTKPGKVHTRADLTTMYGGNPRAGICPSAKTPNILMYYDPDIAEANGYHHAGWSPDGGTFHYTAQGMVGMQTLTTANKSVFNHQRDGKALRLFITEPPNPRYELVKLHRYIGQFELDPELPYVTRTSPGADGINRQVIVFRLKPVT